MLRWKTFVSSLQRRAIGAFAAVICVSTCSCGDGNGGPSAPIIDTTWAPSIAMRSIQTENERGFLDRRGLIHAHSYYSWDACDTMPVKDGVRDQVCFDDFRRGVCQTRHDFIMLSDHPSDFNVAEFPDSLLYRSQLGDELVERNGQPVASWAACTDGSQTLIMAGAESHDVMPVGLEQHVSVSVDERDRIYGSASDEAAATLRSNGAVVLVAHPENWTPQQLLERDIDGFEMYNIHANLLIPQVTGMAVRLLIRLDQQDSGLAHPDLALLYLIREDPRYLERWSSVLAAGKKVVTTVGTDCHRNTFTAVMQDGERVDSYRRLMLWFSNHLLIRPEPDSSWDDRHVKEALRARRLYGAFEVLGYPSGFDYFADTPAGVSEMGADVILDEAPILHVKLPRLRGFDESKQPPEFQTRILRAVTDGFEEVATGAADLDYRPTMPGAYRAEIRMVPYHLRDYMGADAEALLAHDYVWIYSNAIYVR